MDEVAWALIGIFCIFLIWALCVLIYGLCEAAYKADEAMGAQEWQVPDEERMKGYR